MLPTSLLRLEIVTTDGGLTLQVSGDLDLTSKAAFAEALQAVLPAPRAAAPHLDLTALDFTDSAGLEALVRANRHLTAAGSRLHLRVRARSQPGRVLKLGRLHTVMHIDFV